MTPETPFSSAILKVHFVPQATLCLQMSDVIKVFLLEESSIALFSFDAEYVFICCKALFC